MTTKTDIDLNTTVAAGITVGDLIEVLGNIIDAVGAKEISTNNSLSLADRKKFAEVANVINPIWLDLKINT